MWITCGQRAHRAIPAATIPKLPNSLEEYQFSGISVSGAAGNTGRSRQLPPRDNDGNQPLISCWLKAEAQVKWDDLNLQVEREGSMDWITLLIPIKLAVFCFFLWYGFNYLWGWTPQAPGRSTLLRPELMQLDARAAAGNQSPQNSQTPVFSAVLYLNYPDGCPAGPAGTFLHKVIHRKSCCLEFGFVL